MTKKEPSERFATSTRSTSPAYIDSSEEAGPKAKVEGPESAILQLERFMHGAGLERKRARTPASDL
eukprot:10364648-Prorocentrum_lima.AAC.1